MSVPTPILQYNLSDASVKGLLPSGYTPLAYKSSGTQYINTGIVVNDTTAIYQINCRVGASTRDNHAHSFFGTPNYATGVMGLYHYTNNNYYAAYIQSTNRGKSNLTIAKNDIIDFFLKINMSNNTCSSKLAYDPIVNNTFTTMTDTTSSIDIFRSGTAYAGGYWKCYYFLITKNDVPQVDLRPARRDSDGVIGMYDLVSRTFKTNSGSGTFIAGPELAVGKGGGKSLPEEYQQVEYLESEDNVNCYINTGFVPNNNTRLITTIYPTSARTDAHFWFGSRNGSSTSQAFVLYQSGAATNSLSAAWNTSGNVGISQSGQKWYNIDFNKNILQVNGATAYTFTTGTFTGTYPIFLFAMNTSGSMDGQKGGQRIQNTKIYDNETIVRNFIPCYRKSDGKPGMYDVVNGVFYTNAGSGEFILGPSITNCYTSEPNAGSGTQQGLYTNLSSGIYDLSKGWVANFTNNTAHLSSTIPAVGNNFSVAWWELSSEFNESSMPWGVYPFNPLYSKCLNTGDGTSNPWYKPGTTTAIDNITNSTWHHFVITGNGSANYLYVDGVKYGQSKTFKGLTGTQLVINGWQLATPYCRNPKISNFQIFNVALTDAQVKELYGN